ncbi:hypothetical protein COV88_03970 [Candidatus Saccharibacteria bacterium CG11_big_fil_rev_8_21_14_0_20_41_19]|nr:hypothetical protein [Candidatus Saccharibacteria bacterium]OIP85704.1 MAG: hypothetical protein AUK57_02480 [Candidatus Saccharibacteria bacterium CG2_30_41_52]PIQ70574.1 MAG: hypothetical protein COV88_03970 [Candidatus Saccharibacteria bacterium CG11_big_fil_rev_8_21_14_0_20_41_19]PIZ59483.1 MAG: hypothetical protein COY18_03190 [Candidatus Saccharibacteria bacterium CG_4_10_14_0_2_um_filter_41_11]PJC29367.1 MAG: hypothetical protein CO052_03800 [Candidatus Saccharibacteria bacterium CG_4
MFRKIVSNLPFSPALVGQLGFYSKKLRKERTTRKLGLVFVVLALIVQTIAVLQPPESANAANPDNNQSQSINGNTIAKSITSTSSSQGFIDATSSKAYAGDQISYTVTIQNKGSESVDTQMQDDLSDILEYSTLIDNGGGLIDKVTKILSWPSITLAPSAQQTRTFVTRLLDAIPATAQGANNKKSYDCTMTNTFGNSTEISVDCPMIKTIESVASGLPQAGITENLILAGTVFTIAIYFYARSRQLEKEVHLIRKDTSNGTI